ncbi:hypothetical protein Patl1_14778 [Pistacia atlantica]|uniref:Uncharacterized protein n=1 Tax=Pistacia atlantica TaxID=434234 RepID=A0ACC1AXL1_9ROSI|nr:hypothetical protein Patl1_14778 [Pistacia atlantica]
MKDDQQNDPDYDLKDDDEDEEKNDKGFYQRLDQRIRWPRLLRDMFIAVLRDLRGFSLDNDNINPDGGNNALQNNPRTATVTKDD